MTACAFLNLTEKGAVLNVCLVSGEQRRLELAKTLYSRRLALMSSATKVKAMIIMAAALIVPFALLEIYAVVRFGFAEPYSYLLSVPLGVISFLLLQFAIGYGVVKGWAVCRMPGNYYLLVLWIVSLLALFVLPVCYSGGPMS
ncbi:hypothetical protein [Pseudomonas sp. IT-P44]|uniref:hypothetical protein n=1 Tax=Pseudomonas sp. IT-P44 TaxID=3026451 RepID=UPI0039E16219